MDEASVRIAIDHYIKSRNSMNEKAKAEAEQNIWNMWNVVPEMTRYDSRRTWAWKELNVSTSEAEIRSQLLQAGTWTDPLWQMIDSGMSRSTIRNLFRKARDKFSKEDVSHSEALKQVVHQYNSSGHLAHTQSGSVYRRRTPEEKQVSEPVSLDTVTLLMDMDGSQSTRSKQFMARVLALTDEFFRTSLPGLASVDDTSMQLAKTEFTSVIRESVEDLRRKVYNMRQTSKEDLGRSTRVSSVDLRNAVDVLGLAVDYGTQVDLRKAKKIMLRRCAQLHPDRSGQKNQEQLNEYTAVVNAYKTLEKYMEGLTNECRE